MRVLLVQPPLTPDGPVEPPVGLAALAAWLAEQGHSPRILDLELTQRLHKVSDWRHCVDELDRAIASFSPDVLGMTSMYSNSLHAAKLLARAKAVKPDIVTVAGGSHFGALPEASLQRHAALDFVVCGEGEIPTSELLRQLETKSDWSAVPSLAWRRGESIVLNPSAKLMDLADLPNPWARAGELAIDFTDYVSTAGDNPDRRVAYVEAGRGCPFECSFCATAPFWHRQYRVKPVARIIDEIRHLHEHGYNHIVLVHDLLTVNRRFVRELCEQLLASRLPVRWMANSRTDIALDGLLPLMKASGCWKLFFGIESASPRLQASNNKHLDPSETFDAISDLGRHGLTATCSFVVGFPDETLEEASHSIQAGARMKVMGAEIVQFHRLRIWPPAPLSRADLPRVFDPTSLAIEFPYLDIPPDDLTEIAGSPDFFGGYFSPVTTAGDQEQIAQLEMFAHHAVMLAPMTVYALASLRPGQFVGLLYRAIERLGPIARADLDWESGQLLRNWHCIKPYLVDMQGSMRLRDWEREIVEGVLGYEDQRARFTVGSPARSSHQDDDLRFTTGVNIPELIESIQSEHPLDAELLLPTEILLKRGRRGEFSCYAASVARTH
jgi:radical SAM superfamily enzyme YgiQ (UPF0313 family)